MTKTVTMTRFGKMGRFGNQLLQYAYLDMVARCNDAVLQLPPWVGDELFDLPKLHNPRPGLSLFVESSMWSDDQCHPARDQLVLNRDFQGYAQYHTETLRAEKAHVHKIFTPKAELLERLKPAADELSDMGRVLGIHLRRGDYGQSIFPIIPIEWYLTHLENMKFDTLFIATEDNSLIEEFSVWDIATSSSLGVDLSLKPMANYNYEKHDLRNPSGFTGAMDFYPDFYLLSKCNNIVAPNSSFSFVAAMMNDQLQTFYRASLEAEAFVRVDPWDAFPLLREKVKDYPHLPGIAVPNNPYWLA